MKCPECEADIAEGREFCGECGAPVGESVQAQDPAPPEASESPPGVLAEGGKPLGEGEAAAEAAAEPAETPTVSETLAEKPAPAQPTLPQPTPITVAAACKHVCGPVKENDQDYCLVEEIEFPLHGFKVVIATGNDGIGGGTGGERWAHATAHLFLAAMGARIPPFDRQEKFLDREQFWQLLNEKVKTYFFPVIDWVTKCVYNFGSQEVGQDQRGKQRTFGCTWVAVVLICDLITGRVVMHGYSVGDSNFFLVTPDQIEKLNTDDSREGRLDRWVGQGGSANGQVFVRELQLNRDNLPFLRLLLCSDGVSNMLSSDDIAATVREFTEPAQAVNEIFNRALSVEVPFGFLQHPDAKIPVTVGDDNMFGVDISTSVIEKEKKDHAESDRKPAVPDA